MTIPDTIEGFKTITNTKMLAKYHKKQPENGSFKERFLVFFSGEKPTGKENLSELAEKKAGEKAEALRKRLTELKDKPEFSNKATTAEKAKAELKETYGKEAFPNDPQLADMFGQSVVNSYEAKMPAEVKQKFKDNPSQAIEFTFNKDTKQFACKEGDTTLFEFPIADEALSKLEAEVNLIKEKSRRAIEDEAREALIIINKAQVETKGAETFKIDEKLCEDLSWRKEKAYLIKKGGEETYLAIKFNTENPNLVTLVETMKDSRDSIMKISRQWGPVDIDQINTLAPWKDLTDGKVPEAKAEAKAETKTETKATTETKEVSKDAKERIEKMNAVRTMVLENAKKVDPSFDIAELKIDGDSFSQKLNIIRNTKTAFILDIYSDGTFAIINSANNANLPQTMIEAHSAEKVQKTFLLIKDFLDERPMDDNYRKELAALLDSKEPKSETETPKVETKIINGNEHTGEFYENGSLKKGKISYNDGGFIEGEFYENGSLKKGKIALSKELSLEGEYDENEKLRKGTMRYKNGQVVEGTFDKEEKLIKGTVTELDGTVKTIDRGPKESETAKAGGPSETAPPQAPEAKSEAPKIETRNIDGAEARGEFYENGKLKEGVKTYTEEQMTEEGKFDEETGNLVEGKVTYHNLGGTKEGKFNPKTNQLVEGKSTWDGLGSDEGKFDPETGEFLEGTKIRQDGTVEKGKFDSVTQKLITSEPTRETTPGGPTPESTPAGTGGGSGSEVKRDIEGSVQKMKEERSKFYSEKEMFKTYVEEDMSVDNRIGELAEEDIRDKWFTFEGHKAVEKVMTGAPFNAVDEAAVAGEAAKLLSEGSNRLVSLEDIFDLYGKKFKGHPADYDDFMEKYSKTKDAKLKEKMYNEVLFPCFELLRALGTMRYTERSDKVKAAPKELPAEQKRMYENLYKLLSGAERKAGGWERFIAWTQGSEGEMNLAMVDGSRFTIDKGSFQRHFNPKSALKILTHQRGMYEMKDGAKHLNEAVLTSAVNEYMQKGALTKVLAELGMKDSTKSYDELMKDPKFNEKMNKYHIDSIKDLSKIDDDMIKAFQLGFVIDQQNRVDDQVKEGKEAVLKHPSLKPIVDAMLKQGVSAKDIEEVQSHLLAVGGAVFTDKGRFEGAGIGVPIPLSSGLTLSIGIGAARQENGEFAAAGGMALTVELYKGAKSAFHYSAGLDLGGVSTGVNGRFNAGEVDINAFVGVRWGWDSVIPTVGGSLSVHWNAQKTYEKKLAEGEGKSFYKAAWEKWKTIPEDDVEARYSALKEIKPLWDRIGSLQEAYKLTDGDIVRMAEKIQEEVKSDALDDLPYTFITGGGIALVGAIPVPFIEIEIGRAKVSIPNRREVDRLSKTFSNARAKKNFTEAITKYDSENGQGEYKFTEVTGEIAYSKTGELMILEDKKEIKFEGLTDSTPEEKLKTRNDQLKEIEMEIRQTEGGKSELIIHDTGEVDTEIHIDPALRDLAIEVDGDKLFFRGAMEGLAISRERFLYPMERNGGPGGSNVKDVITIMKKGSLEDERDRSWIEDNENNYLEKFAGETAFTRAKGAKYRYEQENIIIAGKSYKAKEWAEQFDKAKKAPKEASETFDRSEAKEKQELYDARMKAMQKVSKTEYENMGTRENLNLLLDEKFADTDFKTRLGSVIDNPEAVIKLMHEAMPDLNEKEFNLGAIYLTNKWFTTLYPESADKKLTPEQVLKANERVSKGLERRIKWFKKVLEPEFKKAISTIEPKPSMSAGDMAERLLDDIYTPLLGKLKDPNFDFRTLTVEDIPANSMFFSGSKKIEGGKTSPVLVENLNYSTSIKSKELIHKLGILEGTGAEYDLQSTDETEQEMARAILEIASPIPTGLTEFLKSPLALKISALGVHTFVTSAENYRLVTEAIENPGLLANTGENENRIEAVREFRALVVKIREAQIAGKTFEHTADGLTIKLNMATKIHYGAYSKCGNASFYVEELGHVEITKKGGGNDQDESKVLTSYTETNHTINAKQAIKQARIAIGVGIKNQEVGETKKEGDGKDTQNGQKQPTKPQDSKPSEGLNDTTVNKNEPVNVDPGNAAAEEI